MAACSENCDTIFTIANGGLPACWSDARGIIQATFGAIYAEICTNQNTAVVPDETEPCNFGTVGWPDGLPTTCQAPILFVIRACEIWMGVNNSDCPGPGCGEVEGGGPLWAQVGGTPNAIYPQRVTLWHDESIYTPANNGELHYMVEVNAIHNGYTYAGPSAIGGSDYDIADTYEQSFMLTPGAYTVHFLGKQMDACEQFQVYIDGVLQTGVVDFHDPFVVDYNRVIDLSITVIGKGRHTIKLICLHPGGPPTGGIGPLVKYWITPDAGDLIVTT